MRVQGEKPVGGFAVELSLANNDDLIAVEHNRLDAAQVRRVNILGVIDTGVCRLRLPRFAAKQLGLRKNRTEKTRAAAGNVVEVPLVEGCFLELLGRNGVYTAAVDPDRETALIGFLVLDDLDLLVDTKNARLYARYPDYIMVEIG